MYWNTDYYSFRNTPTTETSMPMLKSKIRVLHVSPTAPAVDIYANGNIIAQNLSYSKSTDYLNLSPGDYSLKIYATGTKEPLILNKDIEIPPNGVFTIAAVNKPGNIDLQLIKDASGLLNSNISFLRFIQFSPNTPLVDLTLDSNNEIFQMIEYRETTGYYPLSPGVYSFKVVPTNAKIAELNVPDIKLDPNKFYTLYVIGLIGEAPNIHGMILEDGL